MTWHKCNPTGNEVGMEVRCMCGSCHVLVRRWPWRKWQYIGYRNLPGGKLNPPMEPAK